MKVAVKIFKYLVILLAVFIILMSIDSFDGTDDFFGMLTELFMNSIPGIVLILVVIYLWKRELILGFIMLVLAIGLFFLFRFYRNNFENWITMIVVEVPLLAAGVLLIINHYKQK